MDLVAEEFGIASGPAGQIFYDLAIQTNTSLGTLYIKAKPGQNVCPDRLTWGTGYNSTGIFTDPSCAQYTSYPYVMPEEDASIYMHCGGQWPEGNLSAWGSTTDGETLIDCIVPGEYYVIDGVTTLAESCFGPKVTVVHIPNAVTTIEDGAFERAASLTEIVVMEGNENYYSYGGALYSRDGVLMACPQRAALKEMVIPEGVHTISAKAFSCTQLSDNIRTLTIPESLTTIEPGALSGLMSVSVYGPQDSPVVDDILAAGLPYNEYPIVYYSDGEFFGMASACAGSLLPATVKPQKAEYVFKGWSTVSGGEPVDMAEFIIPARRLELHAVWFRSTASVRWVEIPKLVRVVSEEMLTGSGAEAVRCPEGVESIESRAFAECENLMYVEILNAEATIADDAFEGCDRLTIICAEGSTAQEYARVHGIPCVIR